MLFCFFVCFSALSSARLLSQHDMTEKEFKVLNKGDLGSQYEYCDKPVAKAPVNFPNSIAGRAPVDFEMYSGYVNVTDQDWLFYWFTGTQNGDPNAPLLIWTNGGPGCSSMEGATTEIGPMWLEMIKEACTDPTQTNCDYTKQLSLNPYAWNNNANVLYLDQPRYVGYSFGYGPKVTSSVAAAQDVVTFIQGWLELFPEFQGRETFIAGESYGGHYIPAWADAILDYNEAPNPVVGKINLQGLAIGNGCVNNTVQNSQQYIKYLEAEHLIPAGANPPNQAIAEAEMIANLGYVPNYYDYRQRSITCSGCYSYNYSAWAHWFLEVEVEAALNVCGQAGYDAFSGSAGGCISLPGFDANDDFCYSCALGRVLDLKIPVVFYYGMQDTACNYVGAYEMARTIPWSGMTGFQNTPLSVLKIGGAKAGSIQSYQGLTWMQVGGAGHMVPLNQPAAASYAISTLLGVI